jgi:transcriptional regulator with XRE-family HTH domain
MENKFRKLRDDYGKKVGHHISLRQLETDMGGVVKHPHISELEMGKREPTLVELIAYHQFFHVSIEYLLDDEDFGSEKTKEEQSLSMLQNSTALDEQVMGQAVKDMLTTNKGLALLSCIADRLYSKKADTDETYYIEENTIYKNEDPEGTERLIAQMIDAVRKAPDDFSYNEMKMTFSNIERA